MVLQKQNDYQHNLGYTGRICTRRIIRQMTNLYRYKFVGRGFWFSRRGKVGTNLLALSQNLTEIRLCFHLNIILEEPPRMNYPSLSASVRRADTRINLRRNLDLYLDELSDNSSQTDNLFFSSINSATELQYKQIHRRN